MTHSSHPPRLGAATAAALVLASCVTSLGASLQATAPPRYVAAQAADKARAAVAAETADEALAAARHALGWDALAPGSAGMRVVGAARVLGTDATQTILFDEARYFESFDGTMAQTSGTDGSVVWARDWSGTPRVLTLGDRANAELERLFTTGCWTIPGPSLRFEPDTRREGDEIVLAFAHQDGVYRGTIRLDAATHRARSVSYTSGERPTNWRFGDYVEYGGFAFPGVIEGEIAHQVQRFAASKVERVDRVAAADFVPRVEPPRDARFDAKVPAALEVKVAKTGHLLVHPLVDGKDVGWFIFDTGAGTNCIANEVTAQLGTDPFGEIAALGVGGTVPARFWRARELQLGPLTIDGPRFMGLDLAFLEPHFGVKVGGILGFEFLARCVAELDMKVGAISIHDPKGYALPSGGRWEEVLLYGRHPCVRARFEDHDGVFRMDTGAAQDTVTFHYQVTADLRLAEGRETSSSMAGGVGGSVKTSVGEMKSFRLGGRELGPTSASFALEDTGAFADDYTAGNIGGKLLEPFRMVFDYPGGKVGFVPRE